MIVMATRTPLLATLTHLLLTGAGEGALGR
jgi:hypothetical protein